MKDGFIKVAAATPKIRVADCEYNASEIIRLCREADALGVKILVFPELCVTGYTCGDLFLQTSLLKSAEDCLLRIAAESKGLDIVAAVGVPLVVRGKLYNCHKRRRGKGNSAEAKRPKLLRILRNALVL